jgi:hypothetical protein
VSARHHDLVWRKARSDLGGPLAPLAIEAIEALQLAGLRRKRRIDPGRGGGLGQLLPTLRAILLDRIGRLVYS